MPHTEVGSPASATVQIEDDDASFTLDIAGGGAVNEGAVNATSTFTVTLTSDDPVSEPISVQWRTVNGTAMAGSDYVADNGTLMFAPGANASILPSRSRWPLPTTRWTNPATHFTVTLSAASGAGARIGTATATATITDDDEPEMSIANATAAENGGRTIVFDVTLSLPSDLVITATYTTSDGSATAGSDFTAPAAGSNTVRFGSGSTTAQIGIDLIDDSTNEPTETFTVTLSDPSSSATLGAATATGTIDDDDVSFTFSIAGGGTVDEDVGSVTFTVTLTPVPADATPSEKITVDWATKDDKDDSASAGSDYELGSDTLRFAVGASGDDLVQQFMVTIIDDELDESSEQFTVELREALGAGARLGTPSSATVMIEDNDEPVLSIHDATAQEGGGTIEFPVSLSLPSDLEITAAYATTNGSATAGSDFTAASSTGTVRFAVSETAATITIDLIDDSADEANETFTVTLSGHSATATLASDPSATGTIVDNDGPPTLSIEDATAEEGATSMVFAVKLTSASGNEVTASWSTADGTATAPADYTAVTNGSISIPLGSLTTALTVTLNVAENQVDEPDKQFTVTLGSLANAEPGDLTASGTIADDDLPNVSLAGGDPIVEGASAQFTLTRDGTLIPLPVSIAVTQVGEFIAGTDQTTASFDANAATLVVAVPTADDDMDEAAGSITLTVQAGGTTYATVAPASATVTVTDNDLPTLTIAAVDMEVTEGGQAQFRVTREDSDHAASLDFRVFAEASTGYFVQSVFVVGTIAANSSSAVVRVGVEDDIVDGADGELTVHVGSSNAYHAGTPEQVTIPIRDNDTAGETPALTVRDATCPEDTSVRLCLVTIALNRAATAAFTAILRTEDGTARGSSGGGGADFKHRGAKRVEFGIGDQNDVVNIVLTSDRTDEEDETFSAIVYLAAGTDASAVIIADDTGTITITDDDPPARLSLDDAAGSEGDGSIGFVARLNPESGKEITLSWVTGDGSATAPADYTAGTGTVTFAAGETRKTIDVPLQDDADTEASETLQLTLTRTGATDADDVVLADPMATGTITDNDAILILSLSLTVNPTTISEGEQATVTVTADSAPLDPLTISLVVSGTAAADDYTIVPSSITIAAGTTSGSAIVTAVDDDLAEGRESIVLSARLGGTEIGSATITLNDNDSATWDLTVSPGRVTEGQQATVTASTRGVIFAADQTITLTFTGNATAPDDYTITPASITITAGSTAGSATITTQDDALVEGDETIAIRALHDGAEIGTRNITITDNDTADFSLTVDTDTITEEGAGSATVTVDTGGATFASAQTISLTLGGSATATADYTIVPASITIAAGMTSGSATVTALDDSLVEGSEEIAITASQGGSVAIGITDNDAASFSLTVDAATITEEGSGSATITVDTGGATFATAQTISLDARRRCDGGGGLHDRAGEHHACGQPDLRQRHGHGGGRHGSGRGGDHHHRGHARHHADRERGDRHHGQRRTAVRAERVRGHGRRGREHDGDGGDRRRDLRHGADDHPGARRQRDRGRGLHDRAGEHHDHGRRNLGQRHRHGGGRHPAGGRRDDHHRGQPRRDAVRDRGDHHLGQRSDGLQAACGRSLHPGGREHDGDGGDRRRDLRHGADDHPGVQRRCDGHGGLRRAGEHHARGQPDLGQRHHHGDRRQPGGE